MVYPVICLAAIWVTGKMASSFWGLEGIFLQDSNEVECWSSTSSLSLCTNSLVLEILNCIGIGRLWLELRHHRCGHAEPALLRVNDISMVPGSRRWWPVLCPPSSAVVPCQPVLPILLVPCVLMGLVCFPWASFFLFLNLILSPDIFSHLYCQLL